jgi:hypothetical protein
MCASRHSTVSQQAVTAQLSMIAHQAITSTGWALVYMGTLVPHMTLGT